VIKTKKSLKLESRSVFGLKDQIGDLMNFNFEGMKDIGPIDWILPNLLHTKSTNLIFSPPGAGKSFFWKTWEPPE